MSTTFVVAAIGIGGGVGLAGLAYKVIRPGFPVRVNCWFCQQWTTVPFENKDCFDCPACQQYNGFNKDGGYNKDIPAQHQSDLNRVTRDPTASGQPSPSTSHLCESCNRNQLLKVKQLAAFVPFNEHNYDAEVSAYERHLEQVYRLCSFCASSIKYEIKKQDRLLRAGMRTDQQDKLQRTSPSVLSESQQDSDFTSRRHLLAKVINILSLLCAAWLLLLFLPPFLETYLLKGDNLFPFLCVSKGYRPDTLTLTALVFSGMFLDIFSKLALGKVRIQTDDSQSDLPMLIMCGFTASMEGFSLIQSRQPRSDPNISIRRLSLDSQSLNDSSSHVTSSLTQDSSKHSDITDSASKLKYPHLIREVTGELPWQDHFPWNSLQGRNVPSSVVQRSAAPSLFSEPVGREATLGHQNGNFALNNSFMSTFSEPVRNTTGFSSGLSHSSNSLFRRVGQKTSQGNRTFSTENLHDDLDLELDSIDLGTTVTSTSSGLFSGYASTCVGDVRGDRLHSLRQRRPLISPAKLDTSRLNTSCLYTSRLNTSCLDTSHLNTSCLDTSRLNTSCLDTSRLNTSTPTGPGLFRRSMDQRREVIDGTSRQSLFNPPVSESWRDAELRRLSGSSGHSFRSSSVIGGENQRTFCPVDSTTDIAAETASGGPQDSGSGRLMKGVWAVLVFSIATNVTVLYLTLIKS